MGQELFVAIPIATMDKLVEYLQERPFKEVALVLGAIQREARTVDMSTAAPMPDIEVE